MAQLTDEEAIRADERARVVYRLQRRVRSAIDYQESHAVEGESFWQDMALSNQGAADLVGWLAEELDLTDKWRRRNHDLNAPPWTRTIERNLFRATSGTGK